MEYRLQMTVSETVHPESMAVRLFISARDDDGARLTAQVWECSIATPTVEDDTDPITWCGAIVAMVNAKLQNAWTAVLVDGQEKSMSELFVPQNYLFLGTWRLPA